MRERRRQRHSRWRDAGVRRGPFVASICVPVATRYVLARVPCCRSTPPCRTNGPRGAAPCTTGRSLQTDPVSTREYSHRVDQWRRRRYAKRPLRMDSADGNRARYSLASCHREWIGVRHLEQTQWQSNHHTRGNRRQHSAETHVSHIRCNRNNGDSAAHNERDLRRRMAVSRMQWEGQFRTSHGCNSDPSALSRYRPRTVRARAWISRID